MGDTGDLLLNDQRCAVSCIVHDSRGGALMMTNANGELANSFTTVRKSQLMSVLEGDSMNPILKKIRDSVCDPDKDPITAAFAYAALSNAGAQFGLQDEFLEATFRECPCFMTDLVLEQNQNDFNMMSFTVQLGTITARPNQTVVYDDDTHMDDGIVYHCNGSRLSRMTRITSLLFWDVFNQP